MKAEINNIVSVRLSRETLNIINLLSKRLGVSRTFIVQLALQKFIENSEDIPPELNVYIKLYKAKNLIAKIKTIRYIYHQLNITQKWIKTLQTAVKDNGKYKDASDPKYNILAMIDGKTLDKLLQLEKQVEKLLEELKNEFP